MSYCDIDITRIFNQFCPSDYSASCAEIGQGASADTWQAAKDGAADYKILRTREHARAFRDHVIASGGWDDDDRAKWTVADWQALALQWLSGDIREIFGLSFGQRVKEPIDWAAVETDMEAGRIPSSISRGTDDKIYWSVGA